ncbi:MAG TPA: universal stress protein [Candidatus Limnocylindrales bacterium]|nr:universal stress protein [Candidatus Limnocylindrales bacterium]
MEIRNVLFATDYSTASWPAGRVASDLARTAGARLHVVHVVPPKLAPGITMDSLHDAVSLFGAGIDCETALLTGWPAAAIVDYARDKAIDLIVIGTHGRTGVSRALLGSVAEHVVRTAPCPVLTVPTTVADTAGGEPPVPIAPRPRPCVVCAQESPDLICESCRARIRAEALDRKLTAERPGRP